MPGKTYMPSKWYHVANGKIKSKTEEWDSFEAELVKIERREGEYEGQKYWEYLLSFLDGIDTVKISIREESWFTYGFFARLLKCQRSLPIEVGALLPEGRDKGSLCWMKQAGQKIVPDKDPIAMPTVVLDAKSQPVKVQGREVKDWTGTAEQFQNIANEWNSKAVVPPSVYEPPPVDKDLPF